MRHEWEHETAKKRRTWAYSSSAAQSAWFCHLPRSKLLVLPLHLLFVFFYCLSLTGQNGNKSLEERTGKAGCLHLQQQSHLGLKCLWNQTRTITEFHSFPPATLSDPVTLMPMKPGALISHVPSLKKTRSTMDKMPFLWALWEGKNTMWMQECLNAESEDTDKCKIFKVTFKTVAEGLSHYKLLKAICHL